MSFESSKSRPQLVEKKLIKFQEMQGKMKQDKILKEIEESNNKLHKRICSSIINFVKENYGFVIVTSLLIILLYVRYLEVEKKKKRILEAKKQNIVDN
jgi:hypothetical protein